VEEVPECRLHLPCPPKVTKLCPCPVRFAIVTALAKTGCRYCHWEESTLSIFRIEETFKPKCQAIWGHTPEDVSHYV
jgi:hypothetical protein